MRVALLFLMLAAVCAHAQNARPVFEAAAIKDPTPSDGSSSHGTRGQLVMTNQPLRRLIERAYLVNPFQVVAPAWVGDARFDISAKYPPGTKDDDRILMLRSLLEDRFGLQVHRETKEAPGYALVVAKGGFKLTPAEGGDDSENSSGGLVNKLTVKHVSMARLAAIVARDLGEMVVDKTGIDGVYNFELRWTKADTQDDTPTLFTALQETLGVRLQPQKVPVEIIVVDHVERKPTEN